MVEITEDDYYSNMYDIEKLTHLSGKERTKNSIVRKIEHLISHNKCLEAKEEIIGYLDKNKLTPEIEMIKGALWIKERLFKSYFNDELSCLSKSPKECALSELSYYTKEEKQILLRKMLVETPVSESWKEISPDPKNEDEVNHFYMVTDSYIYELMAANHIIQTLYSYYVLIQKLKDLKIHTILDYGAGAGTLSILFKELGYNVTYADLSGKTFGFAKWRFKKRNYDIPMIDLTKEERKEEHNHDCIVCTEVFEHLVNPLKLLDRFSKILKKDQFLIISESCKYTKDFCSHLETNKKYGGDKFKILLQKQGFVQIKADPFIPQLIFRKIV
ncbi:MAG: class I SAM-dependent methyltransferase [Nanoarchaeota archaeon]|nr:class I SAM-dependent methyltransferase [Nanoarchaeota archaeon]